jgi:hypothetical protein
VLRALVSATCVLCACRVPIAHLSAIGEPAGDGVAARASSERTTGYPCRWWVLGVTFGVPWIEEAIADALSHSAGARRATKRHGRARAYLGVARPG